MRGRQLLITGWGVATNPSIVGGPGNSARGPGIRDDKLIIPLGPPDIRNRRCFTSSSGCHCASIGADRHFVIGDLDWAPAGGDLITLGVDATDSRYQRRPRCWLRVLLRVRRDPGEFVCQLCAASALSPFVDWWHPRRRRRASAYIRLLPDGRYCVRVEVWRMEAEWDEGTTLSAPEPWSREIQWGVGW